MSHRKSLADLRKLHAAPKNVINENMRYATAPQMAEYHAMHAAFPALAEVVEAARQLSLADPVEDDAAVYAAQKRLAVALSSFEFAEAE